MKLKGLKGKRKQLDRLNDELSCFYRIACERYWTDTDTWRNSVAGKKHFEELEHLKIACDGTRDIVLILRHLNGKVA
jgi:hypothetical protein